MHYKRGYGLATVAIGLVIVGIYAKQRTYETDRAKAIYALAVDVYREVGNEPDITARLAAHVVSNRAEKNRPYWGGSDILGVIFARAEARGKVHCQFSWTCDDSKRTPDWSFNEQERAVRIAQDEIDGAYPLPAKFADAVNYLNEKLSKRENVCWVKTHLVNLGKAEPRAQTTFYREARGKAEKALLPKPERIPECRGAAATPKRHARKHA